MEFPSSASLVVGWALAILGWIVGHYFTSRRDRKNAERAIRTKALSESYVALTKAGSRGQLATRDQNGEVDTRVARGVEEALSIIHLYGTVEQSHLVNLTVRELASMQNLNTTILVDNLRDHIRKDLGLAKLLETPCYARIDIVDNRTGQKT